MSVVTEEMLHIAITEYWNAERKKEHGMRAALATVAPLIAKAERERCARMAHQHGYDLTNLDERNGAFSSAAAIRALGDET
jgi:hypothetical protein